MNPWSSKEWLATSVMNLTVTDAKNKIRSQFLLLLSIVRRIYADSTAKTSTKTTHFLIFLKTHKVNTRRKVINPKYVHPIVFTKRIYRPVRIISSPLTATSLIVCSCCDRLHCRGGWPNSCDTVSSLVRQIFVWRYQ